MHFPYLVTWQNSCIFFGMVPERSLVSTGKKSVTIWISGFEKRHVTVALTVPADWFILPPMIVFRSKANLTIKDIVAPKSGWILDVYLVWKPWQTYGREKQKELGFERSFMVYDAFKSHKTDNVKVLLAMNNTNLVIVPSGCLSQCQPLHVCINKPFKGVLLNF